MRTDTRSLRKSLPDRLTVAQYCDVRRCSQSLAYRHLRSIPGLGIKLGRRTFIDRDVMLAEIDRQRTAVPWLPMRDRHLNATQQKPSAPAGRRHPASTAGSGRLARRTTS